MKVVLLAGGEGTRISEESERTPKPMIEIGGMLIIWHIMKYYSFREKLVNDGHPINAGFMVLNRDVIDYIDGDDTSFETEPLEALANEGELMSYEHKGFWQCMDTLRQKNDLEDLIAEGRAPWMVWEH